MVGFTGWEFKSTHCSQVESQMFGTDGGSKYSCKRALCKLAQGWGQVAGGPERAGRGVINSRSRPAAPVGAPLSESISSAFLHRAPSEHLIGADEQPGGPGWPRCCTVCRARLGTTAVIAGAGLRASTSLAPVVACTTPPLSITIAIFLPLLVMSGVGVMLQPRGYCASLRLRFSSPSSCRGRCGAVCTPHTHGALVFCPK